MKKIILLVWIIGLFLINGCNEKQEVIQKCPDGFFCVDVNDIPNDMHIVKAELVRIDDNFSYYTVVMPADGHKYIIIYPK